MMKKVSVVMPVYNVQEYVSLAISSVLKQSYENFELIIVDDGSKDSSLEICQTFTDSRVKIVSQKNRGLAGARNTGIRNSTGDYIAFLDSDDLWTKNKLESHVKHLNSDPRIGVSFSHSLLIDHKGKSLGIKQAAKTSNISFEDVICRNPIGNGSSPVVKRCVLQDVSFKCSFDGQIRTCYFDESFKQSEDIEYWTRISLISKLKFEGIEECLTQYRVNPDGLSSNLDKQLKSWNRVIDKLSLIAPFKIARCQELAKAYQLRYLARRAIINLDSKQATKLAFDSIKCDSKILIQEPTKTLITLAASVLIWLVPKSLVHLSFSR